MATIRQTQSTYAITILTFQRHRHFQRTANAVLFIRTLFQHQAKSRFQLHGFVVMPDHTHILSRPPQTNQQQNASSTSKADTPSPPAINPQEKSGTPATTTIT